MDVAGGFATTNEDGRDCDGATANSERTGVLVPAVMVLSWIYKYVTGRQPPGANQLDQAGMKLASKAQEMKDKAENKADGFATGDEQVCDGYCDLMIGVDGKPRGGNTKVG
ncbi:hypothetical protein F0562_007932 [Nyssa sinensis]|uniref:Uncharacterized protein n=1 Tax=Nyssa sinensis TaxID=561372 RepID=A0A5J5A7G4_9ASTE|nr:hypothetical protein F0562_007932 [Nyssa sinensis]